jgi:anaerobic magnesium-protoporphyrin IX monomethyl ester cyclase
MKSRKDFRVLLVYPNLTMMLVPSLAMAKFTGILRNEGYVVDMFDTTHYVSDLTSSPQNRVKYLQAREFDEEKDLGVVFKTDILGDFAHKVNDFKPDLMIVSVVEDTFLQALALLEEVEESDIPSILGGVFVTAAPSRAISFPQVQMIGLGEGEDTIVEVAERIRTGESCQDVKNVWFKNPDGTVVKNHMRPLVDIQKIMPDFSLFDEARFYRPMGGRIFKTMPIETYRGCPYSCTFCNSPMQVDIMRENHLGNFMRRKRMNDIRSEITSMIETNDPEYLYIVDDSFLARPEEEIEAFAEMYAEFKIPFWFNTRPENASAKRLDIMKSVNCDRISFGLECGNEQFRREVILRNPTNEEIIEDFETIAQSGIAFSVNNIIGFPDETRDMIFETIDLNRELRGYDSLTVSIFTPYHGTKLRDRAVERGYLDDNVISTHTTSTSLLDMPQLSNTEIDGLMKTFTSYVNFPKEDWARLRIAEQDTDEGRKIFNEFHDRYTTMNFQGTQETSMPNWDAPDEYSVKPNGIGGKDDKPWGFNCGAEVKDYVAPPRESD